MYARLLFLGLLSCWLLSGLGQARAQTTPNTLAQPSLQTLPAPARPVQRPDSTVRVPLPPRRPVALVLGTEPADQETIRRYRYRKVLPDSAAAVRELRDLLLALQADAYLTASADEMRWGHDSLRVRLYVGEKFQWAQLRNGNLGDGLLTRAGYREKLFRGQPFQPKEWAQLQENILHEAENQGFPFATVTLDSLELRGAEVAGRIVLQRGPAVVFDSIQIVGKTKTRVGFLTRYLQIFPSQPYSQQKVQEAARRLRQLPYLHLKAEPEVRFALGKARVYLLLEDRAASQFDAIVGVLPNPNPGVGQKRVQITGDVTINLRNIKGGGKGIGLQWRKLDASSQLLDAQYVHPNFFGTPLELGGTFNLLKQNDQFLTIRPRLQMTYPTARAGRVAFFTERRSSRLLADSAALSVYTSGLPDNIDSEFNSYGLDYSWNTLDDPYLPRRGLLAGGQASVGTKRISRNPNLRENLYEAVALRSTQISVGGRVERYFRMGRNGVLFTRVRGEALVNQRLFLNDLFRIGGLATLRGFNELNYYASQYAIGTAEFRQFTGADSYVFLFADQAWLRRDITTETTQDTPTGLGAGLSFRTAAGQFQFVYALGRDQQQKFALGSGKIHFGITNRF
ncbi:Outer membrane protein assembly factor BamA [Hymenobacter gelipurpurascens]|uniref:Outer membrane protein assembly factor BamA n=1 Tax=Hymenobacter gelipurpurascens TaxID=89968 RepID=A0A212UED5_9BACT|nr:BamA/TamA family outer membrane protein [Hymenobacter gelipurpurascens]SNC76609.1 Outer membrane protein assembly factor BamA [Hymenobacter gelipurpurascens]